MPLRKALLGACLALPLAGLAGAAHAHASHHERIIRVPAGSVVLVLPGTAPQVIADPTVVPAFPAPFPIAQFMAEQNAMMQNMLQQVRALDAWSTALPNPDQIIRTAMQGMPSIHAAPGTSVVTTMVSDGDNVCRETITYRMTPHGARPQVHVTRTGDDCGALMRQGPVGVTQTLPAQPARHPETVPAAAPEHRPQLWTVSDPAQPIPADVPRT